MRAWREIAIPNDDVLSGKFQEAEFAADITSVHRGSARPEYQDPELFFNRTYITEGMRLLLTSVAQRLCGTGGDPVIQLQTAFGGGKTHTLLAVWHLARAKVPAARLAGISRLLDDASVAELPRAQVAVIDGISMNASKARQYGQQEIRTLWGVLAWELAGAEGFELVRTNDEEGSSPDKQTLVELLKLAGPSVILMDELVAYIRQFEEGKQYVGGSYGSNITFIQSLTEAIKQVDNAILLASLPESDLEAGGALGEQALQTLSKLFGRLEAVWKPVGTEESFNIVQRRLFKSIDELGAEQNCKAFADLYHQHSDYFPVETQKGDYLQRMKTAFPFHPLLFDQLYEEWSTLPKFQRTRGVLQLMALAVHWLWQNGNQDGMILPSSMPIVDNKVRNKLVTYLPGQGWDPILDRDVDGDRSEPFQIDQDSVFGAVQAARRVARTVFLGSAPSVEHKGARGMTLKEICLGAAQPGQTVAVYRDALKRLTDRLHYLNTAEDRYWFDKRPNLRREMEERKQGIQYQEQVVPEIRRRIERIFSGSHMFSGVHVFAASGDVPDDFDLRLVVLPPTHSFSRTVDNQALPNAKSILESRGEKPRQHRNRLLFLAPDQETSRRMVDQAQSYLAWRGMEAAIKENRLVLDQLQIRQVKESAEKAEEALKRLVRESYRWLLVPYQSLNRHGKPGDVDWEPRIIQPAATSVAQEIERVARQEEDVIFEWSPVHLRNLLQQWFWTDERPTAGVLDVWHSMCNYLYMPRLRSSRVLEDAISEGLDARDYFGYAASMAEERPEGLRFGNGGSVHLDPEAVLIEPSNAATWAAVKDDETAPETGRHPDPAEPEKLEPGTGPSPQPTPPSPGPEPERRTRFYGTVELDAQTASLRVEEIQAEVLHHLALPSNAIVRVRLDIEALNPEGYGESEVRTVRENARSLGFSDSEFDSE